MEREPGVPEDGDKEDSEEDVAPNEELEKLATKYEELKEKVEQHFGGNYDSEKRNAPIVRAPQKPTQEQWERHQATHTPFEAWCKHCLAARATRSPHPKQGRKPMIVPDVDKGILGPTKISIDYMYLHERVGGITEAWRPIHHNW